MKRIFQLMLITIVFSGCASINNHANNLIEVSTTPTYMADYQNVNSIDQPVASEEINIAEDIECIHKLSLVSASDARNWFWSQDGNTLYYNHQFELTDWFSFDLLTGQNATIKFDEISLPPDFSIPDWVYLEIPPFPQSDPTHHSSASPGGQYVIYTKPVYTKPTPTPAPGLVSSSEYEYYSDVFLSSREGVGGAVLVGRIGAYIDRVYWTPDENFVILVINKSLSQNQEDGAVWLLDVQSKILFPIINKEINGNFYRIIISPGGDWVAFPVRRTNIYSIYHLATGEEFTSVDIPEETSSVLWLNEFQWLVIVHQPGRSVLFLMDFQTGESVEYGSWIEGVTIDLTSDYFFPERKQVISPTKNVIAFNGRENFYIAEFCENIE